MSAAIHDGRDEQICGVNEQILGQDQSDQEAEKTYRQRGAISWPPTTSNRPARMDIACADNH